MFFSDKFQKVYAAVRLFDVHQHAKTNAYALSNFIRLLALLSEYATAEEDLRQIFTDEDRAQAAKGCGYIEVWASTTNEGTPCLMLDQASDNPFCPIEMVPLEIIHADLRDPVKRLAQCVIGLLELGQQVPPPIVTPSIYGSGEDGIPKERRKWTELLQTLEG